MLGCYAVYNVHFKTIPHKVAVARITNWRIALEAGVSILDVSICEKEVMWRGVHREAFNSCLDLPQLISRSRTTYILHVYLDVYVLCQSLAEDIDTRDLPLLGYIG